MSQIFQVPAPNDLPWVREKVSLSGVLYILRLRYNTRMQRWILDIADSQNNDILNGLPVLIQVDLNGRYQLSGLPAGFLFATDDTNKQTQPTRLSFGTDHSLFYFDPTAA